MLIIYKITNNIEGKSYIGQTSRSIEKRFEEHCNTPGKTMYEIIKKYGKENFTIEILDDSATSYEELDLLEKKYIVEFNTIHPNGYNSKNGGGARHYQTEETKSRMSISKKGKYKGSDNPFYGKTHSDEQKQKWSNERKGRVLSDEWKKKMSENHTGKRKVINLDTLEVFNSCKEAAEKCGLKTGSQITNVCRGRKKKAGGYRWMYYDEYMAIPSQAE